MDEQRTFEVGEFAKLNDSGVFSRGDMKPLWYAVVIAHDDVLVDICYPARSRRLVRTRMYKYKLDKLTLVEQAALLEQVCAPTCPYCGEQAVLTDADRVGKRSLVVVWGCQPCNAWVAVRKQDTRYRPLGTLANPELRSARATVRDVANILWRSYDKSRILLPRSERRRAWFSDLLGLPRAQCNIETFDLHECQRALRALRALASDSKSGLNNMPSGK